MFSAISFAEIQLGFALIGVGFVLWSVYVMDMDFTTLGGAIGCNLVQST